MSQQKMTNACRLLASHIQQVSLDEPLYAELKFLRTEMAKMLLEKANQEELENDFRRQLELDGIQNPWLRELTHRYFQ
jgi:hypothetical protein